MWQNYIFFDAFCKKMTHSTSNFASKQNRCVMKYTIELEFEKTIEMCHKHARQQAETLSILKNAINDEGLQLSEILEAVSNESGTEHLMKKYSFSKATITRIMDMPIEELASIEEFLEYYAVAEKNLKEIINARSE